MSSIVIYTTFIMKVTLWNILFVVTYFPNLKEKMEDLKYTYCKLYYYFVDLKLLPP